MSHKQTAAQRQRLSFLGVVLDYMTANNQTPEGKSRTSIYLLTQKCPKLIKYVYISQTILGKLC